MLSGIYKLVVDVEAHVAVAVPADVLLEVKIVFYKLRCQVAVDSDFCVFKGAVEEKLITPKFTILLDVF